MAKRIKYTTRTKKLEKELNILKLQIEPLKESAKSSHHKISVKNIKKASGEGFKNVRTLSRFIKKQEAIIKERKFKQKLREQSKRETAKTNKALKSLEKEAKLLIQEAKKLKGKRKERKEAQAEELRQMIKDYKRIKKEKKRNIAGLTSKGAKKTIRTIVGRERCATFAQAIWGYWEMAFKDKADMSVKRDLLYWLSTKGKLPQEEIDLLESLFQEWYMYAKTDPFYADEILNRIIVEVDRMIEKYGTKSAPAKDNIPDEEQWKDRK